MPRETTITFDQAAAYANAFRSEGIKPTSRLIRERHGSGSFGTIHRYLQQWEASQAGPSDAELVLPATVQRAVLDFVSRELAAGRADLEEKLAAAKAAGADLATDNDRQAAVIESLNGQVETLNAERAKLEGRVARMDAELAAAHEAVARLQQEAETARTELAKAVLRLEGMARIERDLETVRSQLQAADHGRHDAEQKLAVCRSERQLIEQARAESAKFFEARLFDTQAQLRDALAQTKEARDATLHATEQLAAVQAMRAAETVGAAERTGKLEGAMAALQRQFGQGSEGAHLPAPGKARKPHGD